MTIDANRKLKVSIQLLSDELIKQSEILKKFEVGITPKFKRNILCSSIMCLLHQKESITEMKKRITESKDFTDVIPYIAKSFDSNMWYCFTRINKNYVKRFHAETCNSFVSKIDLEKNEFDLQGVDNIKRFIIFNNQRNDLVNEVGNVGLYHSFQPISIPFIDKSSVFVMDSRFVKIWLLDDSKKGFINVFYDIPSSTINMNVRTCIEEIGYKKDSRA